MNFQKLEESHTGEYLGKKFVEPLQLYHLDAANIISVTQDNAGNCRTLASYMVENHGCQFANIGFCKSQFYPCFLHVLNLACQAALKVYDDPFAATNTSRKAAKVVLLPDDRSDYSGSEDSDDPMDPDFNEEDPDFE